MSGRRVGPVSGPALTCRRAVGIVASGTACVSYDLHLLRLEDVGDDASAAFERIEEIEPRKPTPDERARLHRLASDLVAANPGLDLVEVPDGSMLQLGYDSERPVVIDLTVESMTMSWSFGADEARAHAALEEVCVYLPVFERHGYVAYDPQLGRIFDIARDGPAALGVHQRVRTELAASLAQAVDPRPWWKRWFG